MNLEYKMKVDDIRVFVPCKDYEISKSFYRALGFLVEDSSDQLCICENGGCSFFLQRYYNEEFAKNLMIQLIVHDINDALDVVSGLKKFEIRYEPIKSEPWGKVIYLWGPSGELIHVTELNE